MVLAGGIVAVGVGGMEVGVSVGGGLVEVGGGACVDGGLVGIPPGKLGVAVLTQAARERAVKLMKSRTDIFLSMETSSGRPAVIITPGDWALG